MANSWLAHVKTVMAKMKKDKTYVAGKGLSQVINKIKKDGSYKKSSSTRRASKKGRRGGADEEEDENPEEKKKE